MRVGVTGTRNGMTEAQKVAFTKTIQSFDPVWFGHGDCVGVDDQAATIVHGLFGDDCVIARFPPMGDDSDPLRANNPHFHEEHVKQNHFARNRSIVDASELVIVIPMQYTPQGQGGTWYTYDYARKKRKKVWVIWPNGATEDRSET